MNKKTEITDNGLPKVLSQIITDNVYFLKQRHRVPQTSIANAMHITQSTLNLKLGGKVRWNADDLAYLSAFFNVSVAYLVTNNVTMPSDHYREARRCREYEKARSEQFAPRHRDAV